jgi:hypothetical protein
MTRLALAAWMVVVGPAPAATHAPVHERAAGVPLVLRVATEDYEPLRTALAARLPSVTVHPHRAAVLEALRGQELLYAELLAGSVSGELRLVIILRDGRSFERSFAVDEQDRVHSIATTMANTIAAIREERIEPSSIDVAIPDADPEPGPPAPEPTMPVPPVRGPMVPPGPVELEPRPLPAMPAVRRYELGLVPHGGALIGLGPHGVAGPQGSAGLDVDLRLPSGALLGVGGRYGTRGLDGPRVHRIAITVVGGYDLRRRDFELRVAAGLVVEPWLVSESGTARRVRDATGERAAPLLGAVVGVSPGWYWRRHRDAPVALRLGMRAQLQLAALRSGGMARVRDLQGSDAPVVIARLGGAELVLGLDAALWFTLGRRTNSGGRRP